MGVDRDTASKYVRQEASGPKPARATPDPSKPYSRLSGRDFEESKGDGPATLRMKTPSSSFVDPRRAAKPYISSLLALTAGPQHKYSAFPEPLTSFQRKWLSEATAVVFAAPIR